jgi:hypothetical protein
MKKLINLLEQNVTVGSLNLSNVSIDSNSSTDLISSALLKDINDAASNAGVKVEITTAVSNHSSETSSGNKSRHPDGFAVDISRINDKAVSTSNRKDADNFVSKLKSMGYDNSGSESGHPKEVIWQTDNEHRNHVHVSNTTGDSSDGGTSSTSTSGVNDIDSYAQDAARNFLGNLIGKALGENEIKKERIIKDIQKIKNLL